MLTKSVSRSASRAAHAAGGRIVVIGSVNGDRMPVPGMAAYALRVAWLAGPEAGFVTGAMHTIDGAFGA